MENLKKILSSSYSSVVIDLNNNNWHVNIPSMPGWYFIETDVPISVFVNLSDPPSEYVNDEGETKKCRNYNLSARAKSHSDDIGKNSLIINGAEKRAVYSGIHKNLMNRAREHTFAHPGTAALALCRYPELKDYNWFFNYKELSSYNNFSNADLALKLGEQIWRAIYGWPLLCSG